MTDDGRPLAGRCFRHVKSGGYYSVMMEATMQASWKSGGDLEYLADNQPAVIYLGVDSRPWVRLRFEFLDGRFEEVVA